jgi:acylphosphatase
MAEWVRKRICVAGRVQGVGFRYFTKQKADGYGIVGFVRNVSNGGVEIDAAGSLEDMDSFLKAVQKGPSGSRVQKITTLALPLQNVSKSFDIQHF